MTAPVPISDTALTGNASSISVALPSGAVAGDVVLLLVANQSNTTCTTATSGWTVIGTQNTNSSYDRYTTIRGIVGTSTFPMTVTLGATATYAVRVLLIRGVDISGTFTGWNGNSGLSGVTTAIAPTVTPSWGAGIDYLAVAGAVSGAGSSAAVSAYPSGYTAGTAAVNGSNTAVYWATRALSVSPSGTATFTRGTGGFYSTGMVLLKGIMGTSYPVDQDDPLGIADLFNADGAMAVREWTGNGLSNGVALSGSNVNTVGNGDTIGGSLNNGSPGAVTAGNGFMINGAVGVANWAPIGYGSLFPVDTMAVQSVYTHGVTPSVGHIIMRAYQIQPSLVTIGGIAHFSSGQVGLVNGAGSYVAGSGVTLIPGETYLIDLVIKSNGDMGIQVRGVSYGFLFEFNTTGVVLGAGDLQAANWNRGSTSLDTAANPIYFEYLRWQGTNGVAVTSAYLASPVTLPPLSTIYNISQDDALGITDALTAETAFSRAQADALGLADALTDTWSAGRAQADSLGLTDSLAVAESSARVITDTLGIADALTDTWSAARAQDDPLGISDTVTAAQSFPRAIADALGLSDALVVAFTTGSAIADPLGLTDSLTDVWSATRAPADPLGLTDSLTDTWSADRQIADGLGLSDALTALLQTDRSIADPLGLTDALTVSTSFARTIADPLGATDSLVDSWSAQRSVADNAGLTDQLLVGQGSQVNDPLGVTDSLTDVWSAERSVTDALGLADSLTADLLTTGTASVADVLGLTDALIDTVSAARALADPLGVGDALTAALSFPRAIADPLALADSVTSALTTPRTQSDPLGLSDSLTAELLATGDVAIADPLALTDSLGAVQSLGRTQGDLLGITDAATAAATRPRSIADPLGISDLLAAAASAGRPITDPLGLSDVADRAVTAVRGLPEYQYANIGPNGTASLPNYGTSVTQTPNVPIVNGPEGIGTALRVELPIGGSNPGILFNFGMPRGRSYTLRAWVMLEFGDVGNWGLAIQSQLAEAPRTLTPGAWTYVEFIATVDPSPGVGTTAPGFRRGAAVTQATSFLITGMGAVETVPSEWVGITDSLAVTEISSRAIADGLGLTDSLSVSVVASPSIADLAGITDNLEVQYIGDGAAALDDTLNISDTLTGVTSNTRTAADPLGLTDALTVAQGYGRLIADPLGLSDALTAAASRAVPIVDNEGLTDQLRIEQRRQISDGLTLTDSLVAALFRGITVADVEGLTDSLVTRVTLPRNPTDNLGLSDSLTVQIYRVNQVSIADNLGLTDALVAARETYFCWPEVMDLREIAPDLTMVEDAAALTVAEQGPNATLSETSAVLAVVAEAQVLGLDAWGEVDLVVEQCL